MTVGFMMASNKLADEMAANDVYTLHHRTASVGVVGREE
jgi:hypothetical protein